MAGGITACDKLGSVSLMGYSGHYGNGRVNGKTASGVKTSLPSSASGKSACKSLGA